MTDLQDRQQLPSIMIRPAAMRDLKISPSEYMVLETVFMLSAAHGYCYKTLKPMARDLALPKMTVHNIINRMLTRGLINRSAAGLTVSQEYIKVAHFEKSPDLSTKMVRSTPKNRTKMVQTVPKSYDRTKTTPKNNNKNNKRINTTSGKPNEQAREILQFFNQTCGREQLELPARLAKIKTRLRTFSTDQLKQAITNASHDNFFNGGGNRGWVGDIDFIVRNDTNVEKMLNLTSKPKTTNDPFAELRQ